jgi:hypothetical protein
MAHFSMQGIDVAVRRDCHGVSILERADGRPVARLRVCGEDTDEVLWWNFSKWDEIGDFGGTRMTVNEALEHIDDNYAGLFWPKRRISAVVNAMAAVMELTEGEKRDKC